MKPPRPNTKQHQNRTPLPFIDGFGNDVLKVPLDNRNENYALVNAIDYKRLIDMGVSPVWCMNSDGKGRFYVRARLHQNGSATLVQIARMILNAQPRQVVSYISANRLDLRANNLRLNQITNKIRTYNETTLKY